MSRRPLLFTLAALSLLLAACTEDPLVPGHVPQVTASGIPVLPSGYHYDLWFSVPEGRAGGVKGPRPDHGDAAFVRVGSFRATAAGGIIGLDGNAVRFEIPAKVNPNLLADAIVTIEQDGATPVGPGPRLLSGTFVGTASVGIDTLLLSGDDAFGDALRDPVPAEYTLMTPSGDGTPSTRGVWLLALVRDPATGNVIDTLPGLPLPALPIVEENEGWIYRFWLQRVTAGKFTQIGEFTDPHAADSDGAGPGVGSDTTMLPDFPGSDFLTAGDSTLADGEHRLIVSLEPSKFAPAKPWLPIFSTRIPAGAAPLTTYPMPTDSTRPRMIITLYRD